MGPLLFVIYVNDLHRVTDLLHIISYADDTNIFYSNPDLNHLFDVVQNEFIKVYRWFCVNKLSLNVKKTTSVLFSSVNKPIDPSFKSINLCSSQIPLSNVAKFWGVLIDKHVTWKDHIQSVTKKVSKNIGIFGHLRFVLNRKVLITLYNTLV